MWAKEALAECERRAAVGGLDAGGPGAEPPAPGSGDGKTRRGALDRAEDDFVLPEVFVGEREDSVRGRSALPGSLLRTDRDRVGTVVARGVEPKDHVHAWHPARWQDGDAGRRLDDVPVQQQGEARGDAREMGRAGVARELADPGRLLGRDRSEEEHTSELQSLMRNS